MNKVNFWKEGRKFLLTFLFLILVFISSTKAAIADVNPPSFPSCRDKIFQERGDRAHYDFGIHGIPGIGNLEGKDDVYSLSNGNFLQCFCPVQGFNGWQTNWWDVDIAGLTQEQIDYFISQGWLLEASGSGWNLLDDRYLVKNINFSCERPTTPASPPVCTAPAVTVAPLYSAADIKRIDADSVRITWKVTDGHSQRYGIYYGLDPNDLKWYTEVVGHETNEAVINLLPKGNIYFKVCSIGECGDQVCGNVVPQVLGAAKVLPQTGQVVIFLIGLVPVGYYLYKRFRLV